MPVDQTEILGESGTRFEKYDRKGPFECGNCHYFEKGVCHQKIMIAKAKQPKGDGGVRVEPRDCCEYVDRMGHLTVGGKRG